MADEPDNRPGDDIGRLGLGIAVRPLDRDRPPGGGPQTAGGTRFQFERGVADEVVLGRDARPADPVRVDLDRGDRLDRPIRQRQKRAVDVFGAGQ